MLQNFRTNLFAALLIVGAATPLEAQNVIAAARSGDLEALAAELPEDTTVDRATLIRPLYFAAQRGHEDVVAYLLARGASADAATQFGSALQIAARGNHVPTMLALLGAGADPNLSAGEIGNTPLHDAAERGAIDAMKLLIERGADVNARNKSDNPPIHNAATKGHLDAVAMLRANGAVARQEPPISTGELAAADLEIGRIRAFECNQCHEIVAGEESVGAHSGPNLIGVIGRDKASLETFSYSPALQALGGNWTPEELNQFIADPSGVAPGTYMSIGGEPDRTKRISLIAYLISLAE